MAKTKTSKKKPQKKIKTRFLNRISFVESYTSLILGAIVVLIIGILFVSFAKGSKNKQISFVNNLSEINRQVSQDSSTSSTYTVRPGDDLWTISENVYNNGYKWVEIAKINKLDNPGLIYSGDELSIPNFDRRKKVAVGKETSVNVVSEVVKSKSITADTYTVVEGDNLWDVSVRAYGDGFKWPEIAKTNNLTNPSLIHPGNVFKIPR